MRRIAASSGRHECGSRWQTTALPSVSEASRVKTRSVSLMGNQGVRSGIGGEPQDMSETRDLVRLRGMSSDAPALDIPAKPSPAWAADSLQVLYLAQRDSVFRYVRAICRDVDVALDITATTFERAFGELQAGREPGVGWLLRTARNAAIDADRRARIASAFRFRPDRAEPLVQSPENAVLESERARRLREALSGLPRSQRDAIALRYTSDLTVREIATVIGKSPSATQKLLDRGLIRLKESLYDLA
jgi:RNA polymerase sigma-70 factor, ECF subfamily